MLSFIRRLLKVLYFTVRYRKATVNVSSTISLNTTLADGVKILNRAQVGSCTIGRYTYIGAKSAFMYTDIGSFCSIGPAVLCGLGKHPVDFASTYPGFYSQHASGATWFGTQHSFSEENQTKIEHDVWIGAQAIIMGGITIGTGAIVAAGAVVTKDIPPYAIAAGVPAKILKFRFEDAIIERLLSSKWWELEEHQLRNASKHINNIEHFILTVNNLKNG